MCNPESGKEMAKYEKCVHGDLNKIFQQLMKIFSKVG